MPSIKLPDGEELKEHQIRALRLVLLDMTAREAAMKLAISRGTLQNYIQEVYEKLGTHSVQQTRLQLEKLGLLESVMRET